MRNAGQALLLGVLPMNIFVYGTLLVPKIWDTVTRAPGLVSYPAVLPGYEIRRVRDAVYPAIFVSPTTSSPVPGRIHLNVPAEALQRLDAYEDSFYLREEVQPEIEGIGRINAQAYLVPPEKAVDLLSRDVWTLEWFEQHGLDDFWERVFAV